MKLYANHDIQEGEYWPAAWIWKGKSYKFFSNMFVNYLVIRFPWWVRKERSWYDGRPVTIQPAFIIEHEYGRPEVYRWTWMPIPLDVD